MGSKRKQLLSRDVKASLFRIRPSQKVKGVGLFAIRNIKKGTILCDVQKIDPDYFVPWTEFQKIDSVTQEVITDFCAQNEEGYFGPLDLNYLATALYMNHHCNGNVGCDAKGNLIAINNIIKNQELCFDYALVISNPIYKLKCRCGDTACRKFVTGNDWLDVSFQKKNYKFMSPFLRKLVDKQVEDK